MELRGSGALEGRKRSKAKEKSEITKTLCERIAEKTDYTRER